jgi:hypothetical protein
MRTALLLLLSIAVTAAARSGEADDASLKVLAERWLKAVADDNAEAALSAARQVVPDPDDKLAHPIYPKLFKSWGLDPEFLTDDFNAWDYQSWRHAWFFRQLVRQLAVDKPGDVQAMYDAVIKKIEPRDRKQTNVLWPYNIWHNGWGLCDRSAWVFCEVAYQAGWSTQIVYLVDPKTGISPHTICEVRRKDGKIDFVDTHCRILLPGRSVESVAGDAKLLETLWPKHPKLKDAMQACRFWTPSYPQDYCVRNQQLYTRLARVLGERCPRFGEDPYQRRWAYRKLRDANAERRFKLDLWHLPPVRLRQEIAKATALETDTESDRLRFTGVVVTVVAVVAVVISVAIAGALLRRRRTRNAPGAHRPQLPRH